MSKLERYLEFNWPIQAAECDGISAEDTAIHVMRTFDQRLGGKDAEIERLRLRADKINQVEDVNRTLIDECKRLNADVTRLQKTNPRPAED